MNNIYLYLFIFSTTLVIILALVIIRQAFTVQRRANDLYEKWLSYDSQRLHEQISKAMHDQAIAWFNNWKSQETEKIRQETLKKSKAVVSGMVNEQIVPFFPGFQYNARDARFLGSPVDLIVFDGISEGELRQVVFIEVKTGKSNLSASERQLRDIINQRQVSWQQLKI